MDVCLFINLTVIIIMNFIDKSTNFRIFSLNSIPILVGYFHVSIPSKQDYYCSNNKVKHFPCIVIWNSTGSFNIRHLPFLKGSFQFLKGTLLLIVTKRDELVNSIVVYLKTISRLVFVELED